MSDHDDDDAYGCFFYQKKKKFPSYGPALVTTTIDTFIKHYQEIYCLSRELPIKLVSLGAKKNGISMNE